MRQVTQCISKSKLDKSNNVHIPDFLVSCVDTTAKSPPGSDESTLIIRVWPGRADQQRRVCAQWSGSLSRAGQPPTSGHQTSDPIVCTQEEECSHS